MAVKPGYKQTEVGVIPVDWKVMRMSEIVNLRKDRIDPKLTFPHEYCVELENIAQETGHLLSFSSTNNNSLNFPRIDGQNV